MKIDRVYVDAEGVVEDGHGHRFEDQLWITKIIYGQHGHEDGLPMNYYQFRDEKFKSREHTIEPIQVELQHQYKPAKDSPDWTDCHVSVYQEYAHHESKKFGHARIVARIVTEEEKPADQMPTINDTYWTAMLTLSARIPKGASLLLAYETDQAICVTNSKTPEHHSCTEMGCINDSHVIYRLPKVEYAPKALIGQSNVATSSGLPNPRMSYEWDDPLDPDVWKDELKQYVKIFTEGAYYAYNCQQPTEWIPVSDKQIISVPTSMIPKGSKLVEAYETTSGVIVMFGPGEEVPESHDCDEMGCGSFSHVKYRLAIT